MTPVAFAAQLSGLEDHLRKVALFGSYLLLKTSGGDGLSAIDISIVCRTSAITFAFCTSPNGVTDDCATCQKSPVLVRSGPSQSSLGGFE